MYIYIFKSNKSQEIKIETMSRLKLLYMNYKSMTNVPNIDFINVYRFTEMCRVQNTERRVRLHRASGDSAQNEAERTNSAIGIIFFHIKSSINNTSD